MGERENFKRGILKRDIKKGLYNESFERYIIK